MHEHYAKFTNNIHFTNSNKTYLHVIFEINKRKIVNNVSKYPFH